MTDQRAGPAIFRLAGRDDRFGADTAAFIVKRFPASRIAIVNDLSVQARTLADAVDRELKARGAAAVLRTPYIAGEREYNAVIDKLAAVRADLIVIPAQPVEAAIIIEGLRARHLHATLIGSEILAVPDMEPAARRLGDALIVMLPARAMGALDESRAFGVTSIDAATRAAIQTWAFAVERSGSLDASVVARIFETQAAPTAIGRIRFDVKGDAILASYVPHAWRRKDGDGKPADGKQSTGASDDPSGSGGWQLFAE